MNMKMATPHGIITISGDIKMGVVMQKPVSQVSYVNYEENRDGHTEAMSTIPSFKLVKEYVTDLFLKMNVISRARSHI